MPVVMVIAIIVVLAALVYLARGRGGELSAERNDYVPLDLGPVSATDVALLRPPAGLWGYNMEATDEAMEQVAESIRERDVRIVALEQLVTDLSRDHASMPLLASPYAGARHRRTPAEIAETEAAEAPRDAAATEPARLTFEPPRPTGDFPFEPPRPTGDFPFEPTRPTGDFPFEPTRPTGDFPFEPTRPTGDFPGPPERSHD